MGLLNISFSPAQYIFLEITFTPCSQQGNYGRPDCVAKLYNDKVVIFDEVELPLSYVLAGPDDYKRASYSILSDGNAIMGVVFTGTARAAFELALAYAHERKQGGVPIIRHQNVAYRLLHM